MRTKALDQFCAWLEHTPVSQTINGRPHPADPDPTFHGHSIGKWEGNALVVETVAVVPQAYIAISEVAGVPNNGDMHIRERFYLADKDILHVDLEITRRRC
jgi:hypothetical protein